MKTFSRKREAVADISPDVYSSLPRDPRPWGMNLISVKDFGAFGDADPLHVDYDTMAFQRAIEVAKDIGCSIVIPAGRYYINEPLVYDTDDPDAQGLILFGEGMQSTTLVNVVDQEPLLSLIGGDSNSNKQWGARLADFTISKPEDGEGEFPSRPLPSRVTPIGDIELRCQWHCDIERIRIQLAKGSGIRVVSRDRYVDPETGQRGGGDHDSSAYLRFNNCWFGHSGGYGIHFDSKERTLGFSNVSIENCAITGNTLGGIRGDGVGFFVVRNSGIGANGNEESGHGGIYISYNINNSQYLVVEECEIGNGNLPASIWLEGCIGGEISRNRFVLTDERKGIYIGHRPKLYVEDGVAKPAWGRITSLACRQNWFVSAAFDREVDLPPSVYIAFDVSGPPDVDRLYIEKTYWGYSGGAFVSHPESFIKLIQDRAAKVTFDEPIRLFH